MKEEYVRPHWIVVFKLMRSYWFVFIAPILKTAAQYVISGKAENALISELVIFLTVFTLVIFRWLSTKIYIKKDFITIKSGIVMKSCNNISLSKLTSIYIKQNLLDLLFKSATCYINTESDTMDGRGFAFKLNFSDVKKIIDSSTGDISTLKTKANKRRFFLVPSLFFITFIVLMVVKVFTTDVFTYYDTAVVVIVFIAIAYSFYLCGYNYKYSKIYIDNRVLADGIEGFAKINYYCRKEMIGIVKIYQTPSDVYYKTCKVRLIECGEHARGIKLSNVDLKIAMDKINTSFDLNLYV